MARYILDRIIAMIFTLFIILTVVFIAVRLMPGSVFENTGEFSQEVVDAMNAKYHFDEPIILQYFRFLKNIFLHWDWGVSLTIAPGMPVFDVLKNRIPASMQINVISLFISVPLGLIVGIIAALKKNSMTDNLISTLIVLFISVPSFIFASVLQYFIAFKLKLFPILYKPTATTSVEKLMSMALPVAALAFGPIASIARQLRAELTEAMTSDFMLLATTKGLTYGQATVKHAVRNAIFPVFGGIISMFTSILGGSLVIENIFSIPGIGSLLVDSINANDHMLTVMILMFYSVITLATTLIIDILYGVIDPRVKIGGKKQ